MSDRQLPFQEVECTVNNIHTNTHTHILKNTVFPQHSLQTHASLPPKSVVSLHKRNTCLVSFKYLVSLEDQETLSSSILKQRPMLKRFSFQHTVVFSKDAGLLTTSTLPFKELNSFNGVPFCFEEDTFSLTKCNFVGSIYSSQTNMFNVTYADLLLVTKFGIHTHTYKPHNSSKKGTLLWHNAQYLFTKDAVSPLTMYPT